MELSSCRCALLYMSTSVISFPKNLKSHGPPLGLGQLTLLRPLAQDPARDLWALMESEKQKDMLWAMVVYAPLAGLNTNDHKLAVDEAINALKGTRQLYKLIESSLGNLESIRSTMELVIGSTPSRGTIGMMIRKWGVFWGLQVLFSALGEIVYLKPQPESPAPGQGEID
ncbi:hypothetical protein FOWG_16514 [Fusarium oxysporum f. sp. lycopersici MN25]|nr:hypothetical protein FOWG_16514 [Fusarium oxysporum f. sp. lycopersici MN25]